MVLLPSLVKGLYTFIMILLWVGVQRVITFQAAEGTNPSVKDRRNKMFRLSLPLILSMILFLSNVLYASESSSKPATGEALKEEYLSEELPSVVISYALFCARYDSFKSLGSNPHNVLIKLGKNIDALSSGISTALAFAHRAFIVQNNLKDQVSGFVLVDKKTLEESNVPFESLLFVTMPIESFGNRILVILSSVSPEQTTIFAVDRNLNVELLYDSIHKNKITNIKNSTMLGSVYGVHVVRPGYFLLEERIEPGGRGLLSPTENRTFTLDVTKSAFEISMKDRINK